METCDYSMVSMDLGGGGKEKEIRIKLALNNCCPLTPGHYRDPRNPSIADAKKKTAKAKTGTRYNEATQTILHITP